MAESCVPPDADYCKDQIRKARQADLDEITRAADGWRTAAQRLRDVGDRLYGPNGTQWSESWTGRASQDASAGFQVIAERMAQHAEALDYVALQLDQARAALEGAGHEAKRMDDDGLGEKVKGFFGGGEDDSKIATEAYYAMAQGMSGPAASLESTCAAPAELERRDREGDSAFASSANPDWREQAQVASAGGTGAAVRARNPVTGAPISGAGPNWTETAATSAAGMPTFDDRLGSLPVAPGEGGPGGGALAGTTAVAAGAAVAAGGAALLARRSLTRHGGPMGFEGGSSMSGSLPGGGARTGASGSPIGGTPVAGPSSTAAPPVGGVRAGAGAPGGAGGAGGPGVAGAMGGGGAGAGGDGAKGSGARYGPAPTLGEGGRRRRRGERRAVLGAGSRAEGNDADPVDADDPFFDRD